jgi:hypothetical protein
MNTMLHNRAVPARPRRFRSQSSEHDSRGLRGSSASQLKTALFACPLDFILSHGFACAFGFLLENRWN